MLMFVTIRKYSEKKTFVNVLPASLPAASLYATIAAIQSPIPNLKYPISITICPIDDSRSSITGQVCSSKRKRTGACE